MNGAFSWVQDGFQNAIQARSMSFLAVFNLREFTMTAPPFPPLPHRHRDCRLGHRPGPGRHRPAPAATASPRPPARRRKSSPSATIAERLEAAGYRDILEIDYEHGRYEAKALERPGRAGKALRQRR